MLALILLPAATAPTGNRSIQVSQSTQLLHPCRAATALLPPRCRPAGTEKQGHGAARVLPRTFTQLASFQPCLDAAIGMLSPDWCRPGMHAGCLRELRHARSALLRSALHHHLHTKALLGAILANPPGLRHWECPEEWSQGQDASHASMGPSASSPSAVAAPAGTVRAQESQGKGRNCACMCSL